MMAGEFMEPRYRFWRGVMRALLPILCRLRVEGLERLPRHGPLILLTNHLHWLDAPLMLATMPVRMHPLAAEKWEKRPIINRLFKALDAVFINRAGADLAALRKVETLLRQGAIFGIAPEGTRSKTGGLQEGKGGASLLASRTGATLIPVAVYGQERVFTELRRLRRAEVVIRVGEPFTLPTPAGAQRSQQLEAMTRDIMLRIARLLPPSYRGVYGPAVAEEERSGRG
jgi:1-acyl-sn-glycerol-3-phosphate acyltransferase